MDKLLSTIAIHFRYSLKSIAKKPFKKGAWLAIVFGLIILSANVHAQLSDVQYNWETKREKQGIKIQTSRVDGSDFKAVRGEMLVNASVEQLFALVKDLEFSPQWVDLCKEAELIKVVSTKEELVYVYNDMPFPVKDRDVVVRVVWSRDRTSGAVSMFSLATNIDESVRLVPLNNKALRVIKAASEWHFTPAGEGRMLVESFAHIDPGGPIPAWITNLMVVSSPYKTLENMRSTIESGRYGSAATIPF